VYGYSGQWSMTTPEELVYS